VTVALLLGTDEEPLLVVLMLTRVLVEPLVGETMIVLAELLELAREVVERTTLLLLLELAGV